MIILSFIVSLLSFGHNQKTDYKEIYGLYSSSYDEMVYSKSFDRNRKVDERNYHYLKNKQRYNLRFIAENGVVAHLEGEKGQYLLENSIVDRETTYSTVSNIGLKNDYIIYNGSRFEHEGNMYKYKSLATSIMSKKHKRHRVVFYLGKIISYFCLKERINKMSGFVKTLGKLVIRYSALNKLKAVGSLKVELLKSRKMMYLQKLLKLEYQSKRSLGFLGKKTRSKILMTHKQLVREFETIIRHDHKYKIKFCNSLDLDQKYIKMTDLAFRFEAKVKETDYMPKVELRNSIIRQHSNFFDEAKTDFNASVFITIPLFNGSGRKHLQSISGLKTMRAKAELKYIVDQNEEYERAYNLELDSRKELITILKRQIKKIESTRYYNLKMLKSGVIKLEDYLSLVDVLISSHEFYIDERWKYIETFFNNSLLCEFHNLKGV